MFTNKIYAGIGSRETPEEVLQLMVRIGAVMAQAGWVLRSGHAPGADQAFERGCDLAHGQKEIYLPWDGFEGASCSWPGFYCGFRSKREEALAEKVAVRFHPAWHNCSQGAKKMHTRNVQQVGGYDLEVPTEVVICWTKGGKRGGGTGQALRIAEYYKIPIFDLAVHSVQQIQDFLNAGELP